MNERVILDEHNSIAISQYSLHRSNARKTFSDLLANTIRCFDDRGVEVCVTGSAGMRFAQDLDLPYAQEVIATRRALQIFLPEADVAIELGGEDVKLVVFDRQTVSASDRPLAELLPILYSEGIRDFIHVQSFGCLRCHVDVRGARPYLRKQYPDCNITFSEYDPGVSQINQLSRLKLAVAIAAERQNAEGHSGLQRSLRTLLLQGLQ